MGQDSAIALRGRSVGLSGQGFSLLMNNYGPRWISEIVDTRLRQIADILAAGGSAAELTAAIEALLEDAQAAGMIALTETTRASSLAALEVYQAAGVNMVRWVTAHDARVCPECRANENEGPVIAGQQFVSGAYAPPQHPRCRCALVPA